MAAGTDSTAAFDNPLMPNARLRQIYLAMMQARAFARTMPARRGERSTVGLEACLVSPAIDLAPGDLVSDAIGGRVIDFLRGNAASGNKRRSLRANCGQAGRLLPGTPAERISIALGAAAALQALATRAKTRDDAGLQAGVVVLYLIDGEAPPALLQKTFTFAREKSLPLILVVLPAAVSIGSKAGRFIELALRCSVPAIPTDAADAVALYRVAQESIGHARIGGGPAVVACIQAASPARRGDVAEPIAMLERYMLPRRVVTQAWLDREAKAFEQKVEKARLASK